MNIQKNYNQATQTYFQQIHHAGQLNVNDPDVITVKRDYAEQQLQLQLCIQHAHITAVKFKAYAPPHTIAALSLLTEQLHNTPLLHARQITSDDLIQTLKPPADRIFCVILVSDLLQNILNTYDQQQAKHD